MAHETRVLSVPLAVVATVSIAAGGDKAYWVPSPSGPRSIDYGQAVAIARDPSGAELLLVGDPGTYFAVPSRPSRGSAFLFRRTPYEWTELARFAVTEGPVIDAFGSAVAVRSDLVAIGAPADVRFCAEIGCGPGAVHLFSKTPDGWTRHTILTASDPVDEGQFGLALALRGKTLVVGAPGHWYSEPGVRDGAYVFEEVDGDWIQTARLADAAQSEPNGFGRSVAVDGDLIAVGSVGAVSVFQKARQGWEQVGNLAPPPDAANAVFGGAIAMDEGVIVVRGSTCEPAPGRGCRGRVGAYAVRNGEWRLIQELASPVELEYDAFGASLALKDGILWVGAPGEITSAYRFRRTDIDWAFDANAFPDWHWSGCMGSLVVYDGGVAVMGYNRGFPSGSDVMAYGHPLCTADINRDGVVNSADMAMLLGVWGSHDPDDFVVHYNSHNAVNELDLMELLVQWGVCY